jgi:hypothetical protein
MEDGTCGELACASNADCLADLQEVCMFENAAGEYDLTADGVCTYSECRSDRDCESGVCKSGVCYEGSAGPATCSCRSDCPDGQACLGGTCGAPADFCSDTCECAVGSVCEGGVCVAGSDPCDGISCEAGVCDNGRCVGTCETTCPTGEYCSTDNVCVPDITPGGLCSPCTDAAQCGGEGDACVALNAETQICTRACSDTSPCPSGYTCFAVDTRVGNQCVPSGFQCGGCLNGGCPSGQYCDGATTECVALANVCDACESDAECAGDAVCAMYSGTRICLDPCVAGGANTCAAGFTCGSLGDVTACSPTDGGCGGTGCTMDPSECSGLTPVLDTTRCMCVGCVTAGDCDAGQSCTSGGNCVSGTRPCSTTAECDGGYCQGGFCVDCLTPGDCGDGEICNSGICQDCGCGPDERCNASGECVEIPDPSNCTSDSQCVEIARELGYSGEGAVCDSTIGCYTVGACNGSGGGGLPGFEDIGFGGETDPFNAPCPAGTVCSASIDFLSGSFFSFACAGCDVTDPNACREGETCTENLFDISGTGPTCSAGGGGGFPFPFP